MHIYLGLVVVNDQLNPLTVAQMAIAGDGHLITFTLFGGPVGIEPGEENISRFLPHKGFQHTPPLSLFPFLSSNPRLFPAAPPPPLSPPNTSRAAASFSAKYTACRRPCSCPFHLPSRAPPPPASYPPIFLIWISGEHGREARCQGEGR